MFAFLIFLSIFTYGVVTVDKATDGGSKPITYEAVKEEIDADLDDLEEAYKESTTANHDRYN